MRCGWFAAGSALAGLLVGFAAKAGQASAIDHRILAEVYGWRAGWPEATSLMLGLSWIGDFPRRLMWLILSALFLVRTRRARDAAIVVVAILAAGLVGEGLKLWFALPRPQLVSWLDHPGNLAMPSGHALGAAVTFPLLAALLFSGRKWRAPAVAAAGMVAAGIGLSRLWMGVHWPSDVLAGWLIGAACACAAMAVRQR